jgi:hypothetical protein
MSVRPGYHRTTPPYCGYEHYGSQEATTAGAGIFMGSDRVLLIFVVARYGAEDCR